MYYYILHATILSRLLTKVIIIKYNSKKGLLTIQRMNYGWKCWNSVCQKKLVLSHYFTPLLFNKRSNLINLSLFNRGVIYISLYDLNLGMIFYFNQDFSGKGEVLGATPRTHPQPLPCLKNLGVNKKINPLTLFHNRGQVYAIPCFTGKYSGWKCTNIDLLLSYC